MKSVISELGSDVLEALSLAYEDRSWSEFGLPISRSDQKGVHYQSNIAFKLSKTLKSSPIIIAQHICDHINKCRKGEAKAEVSGMGFVNVSLAPSYLQSCLLELSLTNTRVGQTFTHFTKVVVDYSGPNVAKQMHVGHLRSTVIGDCISKTMEFVGYPVVRQNHIGDNGTQFGMLLALYDQMYPRKIDKDISYKIDLDFWETVYKRSKEKFDKEPEFAERARQIVVELQQGDPYWKILWESIVHSTRVHMKSIYRQLRIGLADEDERGESFYNGKWCNEVVQALSDKQLLEQSQGAFVVNVEGYDNPLIIKKKDGASNYATTDLAAIKYRMEEIRPAMILYVTDSRQKQHFAQVFDVANRSGISKIPEKALTHVSFGSVLGKDGKPLKSREGEPYKLQTLIDEAYKKAFDLITIKGAFKGEEITTLALNIATGAIKFADLLRDRETDYIFDLDQMMTFEGMTGPYVQYAHARVCSVLVKAFDEDVLNGRFLTFKGLNAPQEMDLAFHLTCLLDTVHQSAREFKPHFLAMYSYELAKKFTAFYENCPILQSSGAERESRLSLCIMTAKAMRTVLDLLGIPHPQKM